MESIENSSSKRRDRQDADKVAVLTAWHRVDGRTREALRRCYLTDVVSGYEVNIYFMKCNVLPFSNCMPGLFNLHPSCSLVTALMT